MSDHQSFLTYQSYLKVKELLSLQVAMSDPEEHDELLFIVIHQVYELWFKVILQELEHVQRRLEAGDAPRAGKSMKRVLTILKVLVSQLDILETMSPREFYSFRDRLESASGFQSAQFRELEFVLGHKRQGILSAFPEGSEDRERLERRFPEATLWDSFLAFLAKRGYAVPEAVLQRDVSKSIEASEDVQTALIEVYRDDPEATALCERFVDLDEGVQEWRYRHIKMVERTIGNQRGTGGSPGVSYLKTTLGAPAFPDLWAIRPRL